MDEIFEVDATAVLCKVSKAAVTHWREKDKQALNEQSQWILNCPNSLFPLFSDFPSYNLHFMFRRRKCWNLPTWSFCELMMKTRQTTDNQAPIHSTSLESSVLFWKLISIHLYILIHISYVAALQLLHSTESGLGIVRMKGGKMMEKGGDKDKWEMQGNPERVLSGRKMITKPWSRVFNSHSTMLDSDSASPASGNNL